MFKFSIVTATFNRVDNLKFLYSSILINQNYLFNIEWVVIVEKEDINTIRFLESIFSQKISVKIVKNNYPGKFSKLIKQGIKKSTGDYLIIIGDDDLINKNALTVIYEFIKKNSSNWIITLVTYHNTKNKIIRKLFTKIKEKLILINSSNLLPIINYFMTPGVIVSRNLILKVDYFQDKFGSSNDWSTWLDILKLEKPHVLNKYNFSVGYNFNTISGSFNFEKYYYLLKIIAARKYNLIIKLLSFSTVFIIFLHNFIVKNIYFLVNLFKKPKIINEKKKIFHITRNFNKKFQTGGIEQFIFQLLKKLKHKQEVISYVDQVYKKKNHKKNNFHLFTKHIRIFNDCFSFAILKFLFQQRLNYKIIHLHQPHPFSYFYILLLPFKKKLVITYHSDIHRFTIIKWTVFLLEYFTRRYVSYYHFSSKLFKENCDLREVKNYFIESFSIDKLTIKKRGVTNNFKKNLPEKYILFLGRDRHYKGFDKLKEIILTNLHINFICITNYKFDFKSINLKVFTNISEDKKLNLIKGSYLHINTSDSLAESFGFSILESLSFGVPSIIFKMNTGTNFLVKNNFNGYIIDNFDTNLFSKKINHLYNNPILYKTFKKNALLDYKNRLSHNHEILDKKYTQLLNL